MHYLVGLANLALLILYPFVRSGRMGSAELAVFVAMNACVLGWFVLTDRLYRRIGSLKVRSFSDRPASTPAVP